MRKRLRVRDGRGDEEERSETADCGSRQTRRDASETRKSVSRRRSIATRIDDGWRGSRTTANGSDDEEARSRAVSRATGPNSTRVAKRGLFRRRSRAEPSRVRRFMQDSPPKTYSCMSSGAKDAEIGHPRRRARLRRNKPHLGKRNKGNWERGTERGTRGGINFSPMPSASLSHNFPLIIECGIW